MNRLFLLAVLALSSCAAVNPYAYGGMSRAECAAQCSSYGYPILDFNEETRACQCNTLKCSRPRRHGGCEQLPVTPAAVKPITL